ncbi:MAG: cell wall-binding repeat-containing protein [Coriobacteriia bacterium]
MRLRFARRRALSITMLATLLILSLPAQALAAGVGGTVVRWISGGGGPAVAGVQVEAYDAFDAWEGTLTLLGSATTAADGTYTITGLPNDSYVIVAFEDLTGAYRDMTWPGRGYPLEASFGLATGLEDSSLTTGVNCHLIPLADLAASRAYRVYGENRYETAAEISENNFFSADTVVIASGASFADALAASTLAGAYDAPLLLTEKSRLPLDIGYQIERLGATHAYIIGGTGVVDATCEAQIVAKGLTVKRLAGNNRYHTGELIIKELPFEYIEGGTAALVARGDAFADALSASPFAYYDGFPILLTRPDGLPTESQRAWQYLVDNGSDTAFVIGGAAAVSDDVVWDLMDRVPGDLYGERIEGTDRYDTAAEVADFMSYALGSPFDFMALASGANYPDALAGGAGIGSWGGALVLTPPTSLHPSADYTLWLHGPYCIDLQCYGGTTALSSATCEEAVLALGEDFYDIDDPAGYITLESLSPIALTMRALDAGTGVKAVASTAQTARPMRERIELADMKGKASNTWFK